MEFVGVIVTYNRKELLMKNLKMLWKQTQKLDRVIIIDNHSSDGTREAINNNFSDTEKWINYYYMDENTGGAGGFYYGVKYAYESGADYIYLMDDDGRPLNENTFKIMKDHALRLYKKNKLIFLNSLVLTENHQLSFGFWPTIEKEKQIDRIKEMESDGVLYGKVNPFNGTLISRELIEKIGYPRKEFFLSRDETDYQKRSEEVGAIIGTIVDSLYCHPSSKLKYKKIGNYSVQLYEDLDKEYYFIRNATYTYKNMNRVKIFGLIFVRFFTILLYENNKILRIKQIPIAIFDALYNKMGRRKK